MDVNVILNPTVLQGLHLEVCKGETVANMPPYESGATVEFTGVTEDKKSEISDKKEEITEKRAEIAEKKSEIAEKKEALR